MRLITCSQVMDKNCEFLWKHLDSDLGPRGRIKEDTVFAKSLKGREEFERQFSGSCGWSCRVPATLEEETRVCRKEVCETCGRRC